MEKDIYDEKNGLWYEKQGDYYYLAWDFPNKSKSLLVFGDNAICDTLKSKSVFFIPIY